MKSFSAKIFIIGVNPYVLLPNTVLQSLFKQAGKDRGAIPVRGTLNGNAFAQTLVKYSGKWRLYLNTPMRKAAGIDVGDIANVKIEYDPEPRIVPMHPKLQQAFSKNKTAKSAFEALTPSRQKEILRYIGFLKSEESVKANVEKVINNLSGKERFAGRD
jgi:Uncharacterized protein conserved in bacteria